MAPDPHLSRGLHAARTEARAACGYNAAMTDTPRSPFAALRPLAGRALETALNHTLSLDPDTQAALAALDGRRLQLRLESPPLALEIRVDGAALRVGPARETESAAAPDLSVLATLGGLLGQLPPLRDAEHRPPGKLHVSGDADLARRLQKLASRFDPDWDEAFARTFGEILGPQIAAVTRRALRSGLDGARALARDTAEFLTEESRDLVPRAEQSAFCDDVDTLRDDVERLERRVRRLSARLEPRGDGA